MSKNQKYIVLKVHLGATFNVLTFKPGLWEETNEDTILPVTVLLSESERKFYNQKDISHCP